jgi:hypothetical protein
MARALIRISVTSEGLGLHRVRDVLSGSGADRDHKGRNQQNEECEFHCALRFWRLRRPGVRRSRTGVSTTGTA